MEPNFFDNQQESFEIRALAGHIKERSDTPFGNPSPTRLEGSRGTPQVQALLTTNYGIGAWNIQLQQRHVDGVILNRRWTEGVHVDDNTVSSGNTTNARVRYTSEMASGGTWSLSFDITNLMDRGHPIIAGSGDRPQIVDFDHDIYGRRYFVSLNATF